jgi:hypothetical protein
MILEQDITQKKVAVDHSGQEKVIEEKKTTVTKELPTTPGADDKKTDDKKTEGKTLPALKKKPADAPAEKK